LIVTVRTYTLPITDNRRTLVQFEMIENLCRSV
jgi:hypothetical protein